LFGSVRALKLCLHEPLTRTGKSQNVVWIYVSLFSKPLMCLFLIVFNNPSAVEDNNLLGL